MGASQNVQTVPGRSKKTFQNRSRLDVCKRARCHSCKQFQNLQMAICRQFRRKLIAIASIYGGILAFNQMRVRRKLKRKAIVAPSNSPLRFLIKHGEDGDFLEILGFDRSSFKALVKYLEAMDPTSEVNLRGRPLSLSYVDQIATTLLYLGSQMAIKHLCLITGGTPSVISRTINRMLPIITHALQFHPDARIKFPSQDDARRFAKLVEQREPTIKDVIAFIDGVHLSCQCSSDPIEQARYYNGFIADTCVNNVFMFSPEGKIVSAAINFPGSSHDCDVSRRMTAKILDKLSNWKCCVDQGFPRSGEFYDILVGPISRRRLSKLTPIGQALLLQRSDRYVSLRQASEWASEGSLAFSRVKVP